MFLKKNILLHQESYIHLPNLWLIFLLILLQLFLIAHLTSGILFSTVVRVADVAKLVILGILYLIFFINFISDF